MGVITGRLARRRRWNSRFARLLAVSLAAGLLASLVPDPSPPRALADEVTASGGDLRNGWDQNETSGTLSPSTLASGSFGELFDTPVIGQLYAQPLVVGNSVIEATENDYVYSLNAATGAINWRISLGQPWPASALPCPGVTPYVGVTSTPVYNPADGYLYLVAEVVPPGNSATDPAFYLHAINPASGAERPGWPVQIKGAPTNDPTDPFVAFTELQRPGLLLTAGTVFAGFGSHCSFGPYKGFIAGVNTTTQAQTMWTDEAGVTNNRAGIWQSGGGLLSDGPGQVVLTSGNGIAPPPGPGKEPPQTLGDSVVRLALQPNGTLRATDFFSPSNAPHLATVDGDLGSGGPVGLPFGTAALPHLLVQAGKLDGLFVLNLDDLGGRDQGPDDSDEAVSTIPGLQGQWGHPAAFADTPVLSAANAGTASDYVYYLGTGDYSGAGDALRYLRAGLGGANGVTPILTDVAQTNDVFGYSSGSPVVTSDGTDPTSAVVWAVNSSGNDGATGMLQAFPAVPPDSCSAASPCSIAPLWSFSFANAGKFTIPATDDGRVFIGTRGTATTGNADCGSATVPAGTYCGQVYGFGSPSQAPLGDAAPASVDFGSVATGSASAPQSVTITNTDASPVTIESITTSGSFGRDPFDLAGTDQIDGSTPCSTTPAPSTCVLQPGDTLTVPSVTFAPAKPGQADGALAFTLDPAAFPNFPAVSVSLSGTATAPGFFASAGSCNFGGVPVGTADSEQITITNDDASAETLTAPPPGSQFTISGLPAATLFIPPDSTIPLTITYHPSTTAPAHGSLALTGSAPDVTGPAVVALAGHGVAATSPTLTVSSAAAIKFGSVQVGQVAERTITIANTGNLPAVITTTSSLRLPFATPDPVQANLAIPPGDQDFVRVPVEFMPASPGTVTTKYVLSWTDAAGPHRLTVPVSGTGVAPKSGLAIPPPGGGWTFNGSATMTGKTLSLNNLTAATAGSAIYSQPEPGHDLRATFKVHIGGGTGADGMTFSLLDASKAKPAGLGAAGSGLGYAGLPGIAIAFDTYKDARSYPSANFIGIATGANAVTHLLNFAATSTKVPPLRQGTHRVAVSAAGGVVAVSVDGKRVLSVKVAVPRLVLPAFTGATGTDTDSHDVTDVAITAAGAQIPPPGGGWSYNGTAAMSGSDTALTSAQPDQAGSVVYPAPVRTDGLHASFDLNLSSESGGDGVTFALLNPARSTPRTVGADGLMLGLGTTAGVPGLGVVFSTAGSATGYLPNFAGLTMHAGPAGLTGFQSTAYGIEQLGEGTHHVGILVERVAGAGRVISVWLDGVLILQQKEPRLAGTVRLAFTGSTGATLTNLQLIRDIAIEAAR
jgi:lectin family protein/ASPM-SPD-2-Hydin domain-containing protein